MLKKSRYGQGYLYQQPGTSRWTIQFMAGGKRIREATGTSNRNQAVKLLNARLAAVNAGAPIVTAKITLADLARLVAADYEANQKKSGRRMAQAFAHVIAYFGERTLARTISADRGSPSTSPRGRRRSIGRVTVPRTRRSTAN
jgi:hypothetical protein